MDAFFAAVEERNHPRLRGKPIIVGADPEGGRGRGVVSTANYAARRYGIHSAMPISKAWRLAEEGRRNGGPAAVFMEGDFEDYARTSARIMEVVRRNFPVLEEASIDEVYFDMSRLLSFEAAREAASEIKSCIELEEHLTASIGIGPNKMVAKVASDAEKPDGLTVVGPDDVLDFLRPMPVRKIPGIGPKAEDVLLRYKVRTVGDLRRFSEEALLDLFGKWGGDIYRRARGEDDSPLAEAGTAKSVGEQETFREDTLDAAALGKGIARLAASVAERLKAGGFTGFRTMVLTVRFADFTTVSRSHTAKEAVSGKDILAFQSMQLLLPFLDRRGNPDRKKIRLLGLRTEKLTRHISTSKLF